MVNINGQFYNDNEASVPVNNRGFNYGDAVFETIRVVNGKVLFWEDHYFRLMASMRLMRMEIPMNFTMEFLEEQIQQTILKNSLENTALRIKLLVYRDSDGLYLPNTNDVGYVIAAKTIDSDFYVIDEKAYVIDLYKDHYLLSGLLSTLKTNNRIINVTGSIYARENKFDNCLLLNENKEIVEALSGNIFLVKDKVIKTPALASGCINGVMRKQIIEISKSLEDFELVEDTISPFELQKADELFITNVISGIISVSQYRKKTYTFEVAKRLIGKLNVKIRLS